MFSILPGSCNIPVVKVFVVPDSLETTPFNWLLPKMYFAAKAYNNIWTWIISPSYKHLPIIYSGEGIMLHRNPWLYHQ
jgi:hypothetical protein